MVLVLLAIAGCQASVGRAAQVRGRQQLEQADRFLEQGLLDSALAAFGLALEENPKLVDAHVGMGDIYRHRHEYDRAEAAYERATIVAPQSFDAHYYLALTRQLMGRLPEAVRVYLRALTINPNSYDANQNLAGAYLQLGLPAEAVAYATRATNLNPSSQGGWSNLATAHKLLGQYDQAVAAYREAIELGEPLEPIVVGLADAHIRLGHYEQAVSVLQAHLRIQESTMAHERLAFAFFKMRQFAKAMASYRDVLAMDQNDTAALNGLGACLMTMYIQSDRRDKTPHDEALQAWRTSLRLRPNQSRIIELISRYERL